MTEVQKPVFIYVRHTPKTMKLFASSEISPAGKPKRYLNDTHPNFNRAVGVIHEIDKFLAEKYHGRRLQLERISRYIVLPGVELVYLPEHQNAAERILLKFETQH